MVLAVRVIENLVIVEGVRVIEKHVILVGGVEIWLF